MKNLDPALLVRIVDSAPDVVLLLDDEERIVHLSKAAEELLGWSREEVEGGPCSRLLAAETLRPPEGPALSAEPMMVRRRDGGLVAMSASTAAWQEGGRGYQALYLRPLVQERRADPIAELRVAASQLGSNGVLLTDSQGQVEWANDAFCSMTGYPLDEIAGRVPDFLMDTSSASFVEFVGCIRSHKTWAGEIEHRRKDGRRIYVDLTVTPLFDAHGVVHHRVGILRDVTERRQLQQRLAIADRMATVGTLAAGVAHEINNPLAYIIANLSFAVQTLQEMRFACSPSAGLDACAAQGQAAVAQAVESLAEASEGAQRVRSIVRDLKVFSRSDEEVRGPVDLRRVVNSSINMAWNEIRHRARLVKDLGDLPPVAGDEARLGQVFLNLLVNAAQAIPEGNAEKNEIRVVAREEGGRAVIEVRDSGGGIPPEVLSRVFDPFYTTKAVGVGTGLGLSICSNIITSLGGEVFASSVVGKGSVFTLRLPLFEGEKKPATPPAPQAASPTGRAARILVVDDEAAIGRAVKRALGREHAVRTVQSGRDALALLSAGECYDLFLCDLMMPDMNGSELYAELVKRGVGRAVVFFTGGAFTPMASDLASGVERPCLEKPFDPEMLRGFVRDWMSHAP